MPSSSLECCPRFKPEFWDNKTVIWKNKLFVQAKVRNLFYIPLNFGSVVKKHSRLITNATAKTEETIILAKDSTMWSTDIYISVSKQLPGLKMTSISGTFVSKVFEGHYRNIGQWIKEMHDFVKSKDYSLKTIYIYYTTCPRCAKKYGKNYVVMLGGV